MGAVREATTVEKALGIRASGSFSPSGDEEGVTLGIAPSTLLMALVGASIGAATAHAGGAGEGGVAGAGIKGAVGVLLAMWAIRGAVKIGI